MDYKNNIFILRNIHKSNDDELINYTFFKKYYIVYNVKYILSFILLWLSGFFSVFFKGYIL